MSTDTVDQVDATTTTPKPAGPKPMKLSKLLTLAAEGKLFAEDVSAVESALAAAIKEQAVASRAETGSHSFKVTVPGVGVVGTFGLRDSPEAAYVSDADAFAAWVEKNHPLQVELKAVVQPTWQKGFLSKKVVIETDAAGDLVAIDPESGEVIPGLAVKPAVENSGVTGIQWNKEKKAAARELLVADREAGARILDTGAVVAGQIIASSTEAADQ